MKSAIPHVEISLSKQHMWFFKDGQLLVDTDVVTGNHNKGWITISVQRHYVQKSVTQLW